MDSGRENKLNRQMGVVSDNENIFQCKQIIGSNIHPIDLKERGNLSPILAESLWSEGL